jgi:anti-anti-sigma regulatory factor
MRARLIYENASKQQLSERAQAHDAVGMALLDSNLSQAQSLGWLSHTPAIWGCLGLWGGAPIERAEQLTIAGVYQRDTTPAGLVGQAVPVAAFPSIDWLSPGAQRGQDLTILCPVRSQTRDWGVLALCGWADVPLITSMGSLAIQAVLLGAALERNTALAALTEQQEILQASYERERMLAQTIRELGCPIIPLLKGVLLVPLIGVIDSQRAQQIISAVLTGIGEYQAQTILLDITGVPIVDTQVASSLMRTAQAASLLGASVVMVGIRPEIAQSIVGLGVSLQHLKIYSTLASALSGLRG